MMVVAPALVVEYLSPFDSVGKVALETARPEPRIDAMRPRSTQDVREMETVGDSLRIAVSRVMICRIHHGRSCASAFACGEASKEDILGAVIGYAQLLPNHQKDRM